MTSALLMMLTTVLAFGQYTVSGKVVNSESEDPLFGVNIRLVNTRLGTTTSVKGEFTIPSVPQGSYELVVSYIGFETERQNIQISSDQQLSIALQPIDQTLEDVVISATRIDEKRPFTKTDISAREIETIYSGQDPSVVLERLSPSILSFSDAGADIGNYVQFRMRGIDQTRINTTLNGVPLNDMIDQGVFFSNFSDFGNSVESIQVQRGVGTSSNGVASYAGSINFESKRLNTAEAGGQLQLLTGSFGTLRTSAEVATGRLANDLSFYGRFTRTTSDGFKNSSGSDSYSFFLSGGYLGEKDILKVTAFMGKTENDQSYLPVLLADIRADPKTNYNHPNDTDNFEQELVQVQYGRILNDNLSLNLTGYYGGSRGVFPFGLSDTNQLMFGLENDHYGLLSDIQYENNGFDLAAGIHAYTFDRANINYTSPNVSNPDYQDESQKNEFSFFTKASKQSGDFTFYADVQLRSVSLAFYAGQIQSFGGSVPSGPFNHERDWFFVNPKAGITYSINNASSAYLSFGRTGREPTRTDIFQGDGSAVNEFNYLAIQDEDQVKAEYVNNLELGYNFSDENYKVSANLFYMDFENEISLVGALANNSYVALRQNIPSSTRAGLELQIEQNITNKLTYNLNLTRMTTNVDLFDNGTEQFRDVNHIFSPEWIFSPALNYVFSDYLSLNVNGRYVSESYMELANLSGFELPSYFVMNAQVDLKLTNTLNASFFLNNIFDELYFTDGAPVDTDFDGSIDGPGFRVQPPRNFYFMLKMNF